MMISINRRSILLAGVTVTFYWFNNSGAAVISPLASPPPPRPPADEHRNNSIANDDVNDDGAVEHASLVTTGTTLSGIKLGGKFPNQAQLCKAWDDAESSTNGGGGGGGRAVVVDKIIFDGRGTTEDDHLCSPSRAGNMLVSLLSVLTMAYALDVGYEFRPRCERGVYSDGGGGGGAGGGEGRGSILSYFPQELRAGHGRVAAAEKTTRQIDTVVFDDGHDESNNNRTALRRRLCDDPGDPLSANWFRYAPLVAADLRGALALWASESNVPPIPNGTVAVHVRCGDVLTSNAVEGGTFGFSPLSFYVRSMSSLGWEVRHVDVLTSSLECTAHSREEDCRNGRECGKIVRAIMDALEAEVTKLNGRYRADEEGDGNGGGGGTPTVSVKLRDDMSELWTMHRIAYSDATICSPASTFCGVISTASRRVVHQVAPWAPAISVWGRGWEGLADHLPVGVVTVDESEYLSLAEILAKGMTTEDIVDYVLNN